MNFIFDVGNVLVTYDPLTFLEGLFPEKPLAQRLYEIVFKSPEWKYMDLGIISHNEAFDILCLHEPDCTTAIEQTMRNLSDIFVPLYDTVALLPVIKKAGHSLYYLSNIHEETRDYLLRKYEFFNMFDGGVFSCDVRSIKPSPEIYRHLLDKYKLSPGDCLFFDDVQENIDAAKKEGIQSVQFTGAECVRPFLQ